VRARAYGLAAIARALEGIEDVTALHICFGYGHIVHDKPAGYSFLTELNDCAAHQISIETAQPGLDLSVLRELPDKTIVLGVLDLSDGAPVETPAAVADRLRRALEHVSPERLVVAPDCGMKYVPREVAFRKLEAMVEGARIVRAELGG
jgi:5-methyltetrahydropteroyltriglutamate--homocysteine methyltransferase